MARSGGVVDTRIGSCGLSSPWSGGGPLALRLINNLSLCWVQVSVIDCMDVGDVIFKLASS